MLAYDVTNSVCSTPRKRFKVLKYRLSMKEIYLQLSSCNNTIFKIKGGFFKNYRVYLLTSVAYMGSLLFGVAMLSVRLGYSVHVP